MGQAPGLGGTPSTDQYASAASIASEAASSARSRSPKRRTRAASSRPRSSRNTASADTGGAPPANHEAASVISTTELGDRPYHHRATAPRAGAAGGPVQRGIQVRDVDDVEATKQ